LGTRRIKEGVKYYTPDVYTDFRGDLWTLWKAGESDFDMPFNHDKVSTSRKNVLRGIHGDKKSYKLITCLYGEIYFVTVDNRKESPTYLQWDWEILSDKNRTQVLLSPGIGNGFYVMSEESAFHYKWFYGGQYPDVEDQFTIKWNDSRLNITWPTESPLLQLRDR
jgi:dTDP-4-dehydrorhamnose 3,5-epimerase|tara:strand:+ start:509 stop:1003 length:495 start_codon:yes stop_codon:yes gene_type:complete